MADRKLPDADATAFLEPFGAFPVTASLRGPSAWQNIARKGREIALEWGLRVSEGHSYLKVQLAGRDESP